MGNPNISQVKPPDATKVMKNLNMMEPKGLFRDLLEYSDDKLDLSDKEEPN